ncbi:Uncharacterised protein [Vibrio cholerae]|nr:Uncharacterised protein [Vibrio cholerae]CSI28686.1 Uncharacterised protein [Vibrio cholerae]
MLMPPNATVRRPYLSANGPANNCPTPIANKNQVIVSCAKACST